MIPAMSCPCVGRDPHGIGDVDCMTLFILDDPTLTAKNSKGTGQSILHWVREVGTDPCTVVILNRSREVASAVQNEIIAGLKRSNTTVVNEVKEDEDATSEGRLWAWEDELFLYEYTWCPVSVSRQSLCEAVYVWKWKSFGLPT